MEPYDILKIVLLIFALPAQFYISQKWSHDIEEQDQAFKK